MEQCQAFHTGRTVRARQLSPGRSERLLPAASPSACVPVKRVASLIDERFDHDSCGVGFVASTAEQAATHEILTQALTALARLAHRGATAADGKSSDGVGVMTALPREYFARVMKLPDEEKSSFAVGVLFLPPDETRAEAALERCLTAHGFAILGWRDVPTNVECLGEIALSTMPTIRQVFVADRQVSLEDPDRQVSLENPDRQVSLENPDRQVSLENPDRQVSLEDPDRQVSAPDRQELGAESRERRLYLSRKRFERLHAEGKVEGYLCSLSGQTIVYKAMCSGALLPEFFPDLASPEYVTPFAVFHQRYATNTSPTWHRAQPGRTLAHNGEINTVWGNRARMDARDSSLPVECKPILTQGGTDSTSLDEAIELLAQNGRTIAESVRILLPPAQVGRPSSPFLRYNMDCAEPWDGPAALAFSDGRVVGAALDRNGLRPCRFAVTSRGLVVAGSEAGLVDLDPEEVVHSGRLGPGQMLLVDLEARAIYEDRELLELFDRDATYAERVIEDEPLLATAPANQTSAERMAVAQRGFGYTREDVRMILEPMAKDGKDAVWSMGDDTPLAFLAKAPRPIYAYFRQRFAQVTNPAIDPLREAVVVSLHTRLGPWSHMLDKNAPLPGVAVPSPFLSLGQVETLRQGRHPHAESLRVEVLDCCFDVTETLEAALEALCGRAIELVRNGARILLLTDRGASRERLPVPMAMATGGVHHELVRAGLRTLCGLVVEAGDCRDIHHAAVLIGYGAGVVSPWLGLETARALGSDEASAEDNERKMLKALDAGLAKIMSKMGISVVDSYRDAHLFDSLGLHSSVIEKCFYGTPAPLGGVAFAELERQLRQTWEAPAGQPSADLPDYGWVRFRKSETAEPHAWQPPTVKALQTAVGSARGAATQLDRTSAFTLYNNGVHARDAVVLRDLLEIRPAGPEVALDEVEPATAMFKRFAASAMSLGSLSPEAHSTITLAMNRLGGRSNTGEGGEDRDVYRKQRLAAEPASGGEGSARIAALAGGAATAVAEAPVAVAQQPVSLNNKIKQVASGRFGVTAEYLAHADEIEIKVAQGAKPGEGGQLPGFKVSGLIARLRHAQPGVSLISPPPHHDIYSIEDLAQLIFDLKRVNPKADGGCEAGFELRRGHGRGGRRKGVRRLYRDRGQHRRYGSGGAFEHQVRGQSVGAGAGGGAAGAGAQRHALAGAAADRWRPGDGQGCADRGAAGRG